MQIQNIPTENLVEYARNPRKNDAVVDKMVACIKEFGFRIPIVAKSDGTVVDGHLRLKAARKLGLKEVPVVNADDLTEAQIKAFRLVANQSANWAEWDEELLKLEFKDLEDLNYNLELTGFDLEDIQKQLDELEGKTVEEDDFDESEVAQEETPVITKPGDLWILGEHRLLCGDTTKIEDVKKLMNGEKADLLFTDPPYGVNYESKAKEILKSKNYTKITNDDLRFDEFNDFLANIFKNAYISLKETASYYVFSCQGGDQEMIMMSMREAGIPCKHQLIWVKDSPVFSMGRLDYDYKHEPILYGWVKKHSFRRKGDQDKSVWEYKRSENKLHPTMKPIELIGNALKNSTETRDLVLDLFGGSGSTLIACEQLNRKCYMMEIDEHYCDVIIRRWQKLTGRAAILEKTGETFDDLSESEE